MLACKQNVAAIL